MTNLLKYIHVGYIRQEVLSDMYEVIGQTTCINEQMNKPIILTPLGSSLLVRQLDYST